MRRGFPSPQCFLNPTNHLHRVTSLADKLQIDFALIHRERYHISQPNRSKDDSAEGVETRLTLVGDVKDKMCFILVSNA